MERHKCIVDNSDNCPLCASETISIVEVKEMSIATFYNAQCDRTMVIKPQYDRLNVEIKFGMIGEVNFSLDRSQVRSLYQYLKEYLNE